jgi:hypothetical protein
MQVYEMQAYEMQAYEMQAYEMHAHKMHAHRSDFLNNDLCAKYVPRTRIRLSTAEIRE